MDADRRTERHHCAARCRRRDRARCDAADVGKGGSRLSVRGGSAMTEITHHATPRWRDVAIEQIRIVALSLKRESMVAGVVLGILTLMIAIDIVHGNASTWFDSDEWTAVVCISFLFPFAVWRTQRRSGPAFLWTLPVDRRRLALTRVFAGWVWLGTVLAFFVLWHKALAILSGVAGARTTPLLSVTGATAMYLLGSALLLGLRHPLRWLLGTGGVFFLMATLNESLGRTGGTSRMFAWSDPLRRAVSSRRFLSAVDHAAIVWRTYPRLVSATAIILWIAAGAIALWAAASRHGELRRH